MVALCKAPTKSAGIGLPITAVCKNAGKKTLGQDDFFVVKVSGGMWVMVNMSEYGGISGCHHLLRSK